MSEVRTVDRPTSQLKKAPEGLRLRPYAGEADIPVIANILNRELEHDGVPFREPEEDIRVWLSNPNEKFDASRDVTIAEIDGVAVGYGQRSWVDTTIELFREHRTDGAVLPEWQRRGIGTALLANNIEKHRELARTHETDLPRILGSFTSDRMPGSNALLRDFAFEQTRWFFEMTRDLSQPIPELPVPEGLEVRPVTNDTIRQIWDADVEAFADHWGGFDASEENFRRFISKPAHDPTLWIIAWDGDEVAGG